MPTYKTIIENSKSSKATCGRCNQFIEKGVVRVQEVDTTFRHFYYGGEGESRGYGIQKWFVHLSCHQPKFGAMETSFYDMKGLNAAGKREFTEFLEKLEETEGVNIEAKPVLEARLRAPDMDEKEFKRELKKCPDWTKGGLVLAQIVADKASKKGGKGKKRTAPQSDDDEEEKEEEDEEDENNNNKTKTKTKAKKAAGKKAAGAKKAATKKPAAKRKNVSDDEDEEEEDKPKPKPKRAAKKAKK